MNAAKQTACRYRVSLHRVKGGWCARVIELPGCIARGESEVEAIENARAMIRSYAGVAQALCADSATVVLEISV